MSDSVLKAISDSDQREIVKRALDGGWVFSGFTGKNYAKITWPATGQSLTFGCTPSVASWKTLATDIKRVSGIEVWRKGNRKRSHKADQNTDFDLSTVRKEQSNWHQQWGAFAERLQKEHEELKNQLLALKEEGTHKAINEAKLVIRKLAKVEGYLDDLHQPYESFDPTARSVAARATIVVTEELEESGVPAVKFTHSG